MSGEAPCAAADGVRSVRGVPAVAAGRARQLLVCELSIAQVAHRLRDGALRVVEQPVGERLDLLVGRW